MGKLRNIARRADATEGNPKSGDESPGHEHPHINRRRLDTSADDDDHCACEHACAAPKVVIHGARENYCRDRSDVVYRENCSG